jgi:hypothetical protein
VHRVARENHRNRRSDGECREQVKGECGDQTEAPNQFVSPAEAGVPLDFDWSRKAGFPLSRE